MQITQAAAPRLAGPSVLSLFGSLRQVAERGLAEVDRIVRGDFDERDAMEAVSREELLDRVRDGLVTVLDVRSADEFAAGHVPGALNIPLHELEQRIAEFNPDQDIVAYCRGAYFVMSFEAVAALRARFQGAKAGRWPARMESFRLADRDLPSLRLIEGHRQSSLKHSVYWFQPHRTPDPPAPYASGDTVPGGGAGSGTSRK